jgi:hypothetical protein
VAGHVLQQLFDLRQDNIFQRARTPFREAVFGHQPVKVARDAREFGTTLDQPVKCQATLFGLAGWETRRRSHARRRGFFQAGFRQSDPHKVSFL